MSASAEAGAGTCGALAATGRLERRHVDQEQAPPGAAAEAAIAQSVELEGVPPAQTHAVEADEHARERQRGSLLTLSVAAAGVVFGDIGTSPLYVMRAAFGGEQD